MAWLTVFVDDAVCGRLPPVCAKTGRPSDGRLAVSHDDVRGASSVSTAWLLPLLLFPPIGWQILLLLATLVVCVIGALLAEWRVGQASVAVDLDASRRWVTLRGVAPEFARAVRARQSRSDQLYPAR